MDSEKRMDYVVKLSGTMLTFLTVIIGVYQFNNGQRLNKEKEIEQSRRETASRNYQLNMQVLSKFKENQQKIYSETMSVIGFLSNNTEQKDSVKFKELVNRFYQLYWVDLAPVESKAVDSTLLFFKNDLDNLRRNNFRDIDKNRVELQLKANDVAEAISQSLRDWKLPGGLTGLDTSTAE